VSEVGDEVYGVKEEGVLGSEKRKGDY